MQNIQRVSSLFRLLFQTVFVAMAVLSLIAWLNVPEPLHFLGQNTDFVFSVIPRHLPILQPLQPMQHFYCFLLGLIPLGIHLGMIYYLIQLFSLYEEGKIFFMANVVATRRIGWLLVIQQIVNPIYEAVVTPLLTWYNPVGERVISADFSNGNVGLLLMGAMIILVSWIMAEGCKLREEHDLTV